MKMWGEKVSCIKCKVAFMVLAVVMLATNGWTQNHDLVISSAPDVTSVAPVNWKSPDLKIGADFGDTSIPDVIQRGRLNSIYAKFRINGTQDHTIPSGDIQIKFYWRNATIGETPPALSDPSWHYIDRLLVTYISSDGPFTITRIWPADFPSVTSDSITWDVPVSGNYFQVAAEVVYPAGIVDENPGDNVAVSLYESQSGLLDVVLLHDVSGSMGYYSYDGFSYMQQSISKASLFLASMNEAHRFSVVAFSSSYAGGSEDVWPASPPMLQPATDSHKGSAIAAISGLSDSGATPLGQGLERAIEILTTPLEPDRKRIILILSDGYENCGTPRACNSGDPAGPCIGTTLLSQLQSNNIRVFTVALGTAAWTECLECLANQTSGQWYSAPDAGVTLAQVYLDILQAYSADDLYRLDYGVSGGGDDKYATYFEEKDNVLYFILSWDDLEASLDLKLKAPTRTRLKTKVFKGKGYMVIKVKDPAKGTWAYSVIGDIGKKYLVAVRSDRVGIRLGMDIKSQGVVGGNIKIQARLADGKKPVTKARLSAVVQVPIRQSLTTTLRNISRKHIRKYQTAPVDSKELNKHPDISPRAAFIKRITTDKQKPLLKTRSVKVSLRHIGKGVYTGSLKGKNATIAGAYRVTVISKNKKFQRTFSKQLQLQPGEIDYRKSFAEIAVVKSARNKPNWLFRVYAVDRFGNAITDPSLAKRIKADLKGARLFRQPETTLGAWQQKVSVYAGQKPVLKTVTIDGRTVKIKR